MHRAPLSAGSGSFDPITVESEADDHKACYPGSHRIRMRVAGDSHTGQLLGLQLCGHLTTQVAKRIDIAATATVTKLTPGQGSPPPGVRLAVGAAA